MNSLSFFLRAVTLVCVGVLFFASSVLAQNANGQDGRSSRDVQDSCKNNDVQDFGCFFPAQAKTFNKRILSPEAFFGAKTAELHLSYEMVFSYLQYLERVSDRVKLEVLGRTYESKPFVSATISSAYNIKNLDLINKAHLKEIEGLGSAEVDGLAESGASDLASSGGLPVVNWLGYSVHGNEASGVNASVVVAYVLAACEDDYIMNILDNSVVLLLPALNPDGVSRYASWVNSNISFAKNGDALGRESREMGPSSRSNHYWFDLNRDWLLAVHPEGRAILKGLHHWQPAIVSDFHEHGSATGTFFSPGIESSTNKVIYPPNWKFTNKIAAFHQNYMEDIGTLYFSGEGYDDFYPGKGGCYPDLLGSIGILYEQPSSRGLNRIREGIDVSLAVSVRNQVFCSFSALMAGVTMKQELRDYRQNYLKWRKQMYDQFKDKAYVFTTREDISLGLEFLSLLDAHNISYRIDGKSVIVPLEQSSISVIRTIFETEKEFKDSTFYDVSTWTPALAYNLKYSLVTLPEISKPSSKPTSTTSTTSTSLSPSSSLVEATQVPAVPQKAGFAYLFEMNDFYSYNFLYYLLDKGVYLKAADSKFSFDVGNGLREFANGTIMIPVKLQNFNEQQLYNIINDYFTNLNKIHANNSLSNNHASNSLSNNHASNSLSNNHASNSSSNNHASNSSSNNERNNHNNFSSEIYNRGFIEKGLVEMFSVDQGVGKGFDLGSPRFKWVSKPAIAILVGDRASYGTIGELWQLLDFKFRVPVTLLDYSLVNASNLSNYNVIILANEVRLSESATQDLTKWANGNTLITIGSAVDFAIKNKLIDIKFKSLGSGSSGRGSLDSTKISYAYGLTNSRFNPFNGVILESKIDLTHPLAIGFKDSSLPIFKRSTLVVESVRNPFSVFSRIGKLSGNQTPLLSGYMTPPVIKMVNGTPYVISQRGLLFFPDNPNFRGYWLGTARTFMNAIFFRELL